ncbi:MAG: NAD(P)-dependent methylenetetrahydromethanopterin dehydrogenase [Candidatus Bathyarchaeia archaeon]
MKTLEVAPLKNKHLSILIVEKEYNEPFWISEKTRINSQLQTLYQPSIGFQKFLENIMKNVKPDFATDERGMRSQKEFEENSLTKVFKSEEIPFFAVDIDENARAYLAANLDKKIEQRDSILKILSDLSRQGDEKSTERDYLVAYGQCLQLELEEQEKEAAFPIRESWIAMGIMEHAQEVESKQEIVGIHISSPEHVEGVKKLLEKLNVRVETVKITKKVVSTQTENTGSKELSNLLQSMQIQVKPVIGKATTEAPYLLFYLDTDEKASPFDICMAYDAGYDAVIPYEKVTPEDARKIIQDAVFSREPKAVKRTCFFIGGKDTEKAEDIYKVAKETMFPPFKASVIVDPGGAYTTAAAMVAKVEDALISHKLGELKDKTCAVMGTGSVGQIAAVLLAKLGCNAIIASINPKRADGKAYAEEVAKALEEGFGVKVQGVFAPTPAEKLEILKKADVVFCAGGRGIRVIEKELLKEVNLMKVLVDVNTIPPYGVEGLELKDDMKEIEQGVFGIGGLAIGDLKHKLEKEILRDARAEGKEVYNYNMALEIARKLLQKELAPSKLTLTLNYSSDKKN